MTQLEQELKFDVIPGDAAELAALPVLRGAASSTCKRLRSVYFDTDDDDICHAGAILRIRHADNRRIQTVKCSRLADAAMRRDETEQEIESDFPELSAVAGTCLERLLKKSRIRERLAAKFEVDVERNAWTVLVGSAEIEVAVDRGKIVSPGASADLCELELELKKGDLPALFQTARQIGAHVPLHLNLIAKGERGYRLIRGKWDRPQKAEPVRLLAGMSAGEALRSIGAECLRHFLLNERLLHDADEAEPVHQARVAIRRLRAALVFFKSFANDAKFASLNRELKWIADLLGEARNFDVLQSEVIKRAYEKDSVLGLDELADEVERRRRAAYGRLIAALASPRSRDLLVDLAEWLSIGDWCRGPDGLGGCGRDQKIETFAVRELERRRRKLVKRAPHLRKLDDRRRHRIRIEAKKLRYIAEFFVGIFPERKVRRDRFCLGLQDLQKILGELNDRKAAARFLSRLAAEIPLRKRLGRDAVLLFAAGRIGRALELTDDSEPLRQAVETARKLAEATPFWQ